MLSEQNHNSMRKVAFVHINYPAGGVEAVTSMLADYLIHDKQYEVFVFSKGIQKNLLTNQDQANIKFIQVNNDDLFNENITQNNLINKINELKIDVIILPIFINFAFKKIKESTNAKIIFAYHSMPFYEIEHKKQLSLKKAATYSSLRRWYYTNYRLPKKLDDYHQYLNERFLSIHKICDAFVVLCQPYQLFFERELKLDDNSKIISITNAIPPRISSIPLDKKKQILYVGRMTYHDKRIDRLIDIWKNIYKKFPDWEFVLVGDGEERENLEQQAKNYGLERICFNGATNNPYEYYDNASILCLSSQFEGVPLVLLEAQQSGVIPIAFNCAAGVESVLSPNWENGVLIEDFSIAEYENALCQLMSDASLRQQIQKNIINKAKEYNIKMIGDQWHELFDRLITSS